MANFLGKTFIVTGASLGLGRALSLALAGAGARLVLNARGPGALHECAVLCGKAGARVQTVAESTGAPGVAERCVQAALDLGGFSGFIHAAGVLRPGPFLWETADEDFDEVMEASVTGAFRLLRAAIPPLRLAAGGGVAVFFGSAASGRTVPGIGVYGAAKAAEEHLAVLLATEAPEVTTFVYRPGTVETRMQGAGREAEGGGGRLVRGVFRGFRDRGELLTPEASAGALVNMLSSDPARFHGKIVSWRDGISPREPGA